VGKKISPRQGLRLKKTQIALRSPPSQSPKPIPERRSPPQREIPPGPAQAAATNNGSQFHQENGGKSSNDAAISTLVGTGSGMCLFRGPKRTLFVCSCFYFALTPGLPRGQGSFWLLTFLSSSSTNSSMPPSSKSTRELLTTSSMICW
jgi:hypothetical protein